MSEFKPLITAEASCREAGDWRLEKEIGSGSFAKVWKATHKHTQQAAAVKEINMEKLNKKLQESLASEVAVLNHTQHKNIVGLLDLIRVGASYACKGLQTAAGIGQTTGSGRGRTCGARPRSKHIKSCMQESTSLGYKPVRVWFGADNVT